MASLHPTHGARVVLEREAIEPDGARYRVDVYEPDDVQHTADLAIGEALTLRWRASAAPEWIEVFVTRLAKGLPKKHAADKSWPRKITRWREPVR